MKILLLGSTGRTGRHLLDQALNDGYEVHALVRFPEKLPKSSQLTVFTGTATDSVALETAMKECEAVLSALNISRKSDFPWSGLRTPKDFLSQSMKNIISACNRHGIKRLIVTSAWGVGETRKDIPGWFRWFIDHSNIKYPYTDHGIAENILKVTDLEWTIVRPAGLTNSRKQKKIKVSLNNEPKPGLLISRRNVAKFMMDSLRDHTYVRELPVISQ